MKTPAKRVQGLGTAKTGVHHWWMQRLSALLMLPLALYFVVQVVRAVQLERDVLAHLIDSPFKTITMLLFLTVGLYHSSLGIQVIIEDYVHGKVGKYSLLIAVRFVAFITAVSVAVALLYAHVTG